MATKGEKIVGSILGAATGGGVAYCWANNNDNIEDDDIIWYTLGGMVLGALSGYALACLLGSSNNTVNYTQYNKRKRVYDGVTYTDRFDTRMAEHRADGKVFTRVVKDNPKPRVEALKLEKTLIKKYKPEYNIQHNKN